MNDATQLRAAQIRRLAGLASIVGALLAAIETMRANEQAGALKLCADLAADVADDLVDLTGSAA